MQNIKINFQKEAEPKNSLILILISVIMFEMEMCMFHINFHRSFMARTLDNIKIIKCTTTKSEVCIKI